MKVQSHLSMTQHKTDWEKFLLSPRNSFFQIPAIYLVRMVCMIRCLVLSFMQGWEVCWAWNLQFEILGKNRSVSFNQLGGLKKLCYFISFLLSVFDWFVGQLGYNEEMLYHFNYFLVGFFSQDFNSLTTIADPDRYKVTNDLGKLALGSLISFL